MERNDVIKEINFIFTDVLDNPDIVLTDETHAGMIEEWDSLTHIQLVVAVEKYFKIRFTSKEIQSWNNVGEMVDSVLEKTSSGKI